jgi:hypothetical protein
MSESSLTDLAMRINMLMIPPRRITVICLQPEKFFKPLVSYCLFDAGMVFSSAVRSIARYISKVSAIGIRYSKLTSQPQAGEESGCRKYRIPPWPSGT